MTTPEIDTASIRLGVMTGTFNWDGLTTALISLCDALDAARAETAAVREELAAANERIHRCVDVVNGMGRHLTGAAVLKALSAESPRPSWQARCEAAEAEVERLRDVQLRQRERAEVAEARVAELDDRLTRANSECHRQHDRAERVAYLPRGRYVVTETADGWDVRALDVAAGGWGGTA